jgi:hypothetical protein
MGILKLFLTHAPAGCQASREKHQHRRFLGVKVAKRLEHLLGFVMKGFQQRSVHIRVDDPGVDITFSAYGLGVAESFGDRLDGAYDVLFANRFGIDLLEFLERPRGQNRSCPGAEIFGGEILA